MSVKYDNEKEIISKIKYRLLITTCINGAFYVIIKLYNYIPTCLRGKYEKYPTY